MAVRDNVKALIEPALKVIGYDLADVTFRKEGSDYVLRVILDKDGPIGMDDIVRASDLISPLLDEADYIKSRYLLDVTSLGVEKPIDPSRLERYIDQRINVTLATPQDKESSCEGMIQSIDEDAIVLEVDSRKKGTMVTIERSNIAKARLAIKI